MVEDEAGILDSLDKRLGVGSSGANVEGDADDVEVQLLRELEKLASAVHGCAEFLAEAAQTG